MKIVFVIFCSLKVYNAFAWTNIGYLVSAIKQVQGLDASVRFFDLDDVDGAVETLSKEPMHILAMPILQYNLNAALKFIRCYKKIHPSIKIVTGNITATIYAHEIMTDYPEIDYTVLGEAETTLVELCRAIISGRSVGTCPGLVYREHNTIHETAPRAPIDDLDSIAFPDREHYHNEFSFYPIVGSRGCDGYCTFCDANAIYKHTKCKTGVRYRSANNIIQEIKYLQTNYAARKVFFSDSTFGDEQRLQDLYESMLQSDTRILIELNLRCDSITQKAARTIKDMSSLGLASIFLGVESGNQEDLMLYNKISDVAQNNLALSALRELYDRPIPEIYLRIGFINFNAYSTLDKLTANLEFLDKNNVSYDFRTITSRLQITPSLPLTKKMQRDGLLTHDVDYHLTDSYAYRFEKENVDKLYRLLLFCHQTINPIIYDRLYYFYKYMHTIIGTTRYDDDMRAWSQYNTLISEIVYKLFFLITDNISKDVPFIKQLILTFAQDDIWRIRSLQEVLNNLGKKLAKQYFAHPPKAVLVR